MALSGRPLTELSPAPVPCCCLLCAVHLSGAADSNQCGLLLICSVLSAVLIGFNMAFSWTGTLWWPEGMLGQ
jgi:hypothetical protein